MFIAFIKQAAMIDVCLIKAKKMSWFSNLFLFTPIPSRSGLMFYLFNPKTTSVISLLDIVSIESFSYWGNSIVSKRAFDEIFKFDGIEDINNTEK